MANGENGKGGINIEIQLKISANKRWRQRRKEINRRRGEIMHQWREA